MTFKKRYLEEAIDWKSIKEKLKASSPALMGLAGAGLGVAYNYMNDGAAEYQAEKQAELNQFLNKEVPAVQQREQLVDFDTFKKYINNYQDKEVDSFWGDKLPFTDSNADAIHKMEEIMKKDPRFQDNMIGSYKINPYADASKQWELYKNQALSTHQETSPEDIIKNNPELAAKNADLENEIKHAARNSYVKSAVTGGLLSSGGYLAGKFAKRKLDERKRGL